MSTVTGYRQPPTVYLNQIAPPEPPRGRKSLVLVAATAFVLLAVAGVVFLAANRGETVAVIANTSGQAIEKCRTAVAERLKAPGSARFGDVRYTPESDIAGRVTGWVDAENSFGALVRNRFVCTAYNPSGSWFIQDVTFSDW